MGLSAVALYAKADATGATGAMGAMGARSLQPVRGAQPPSTSEWRCDRPVRRSALREGGCDRCDAEFFTTERGFMTDGIQRGRVSAHRLCGNDQRKSVR